MDSLGCCGRGFAARVGARTFVAGLPDRARRGIVRYLRSPYPLVAASAARGRAGNVRVR